MVDLQLVQLDEDRGAEHELKALRGLESPLVEGGVVQKCVCVRDVDVDAFPAVMETLEESRLSGEGRVDLPLGFIRRLDPSAARLLHDVADRLVGLLEVSEDLLGLLA